MAYIGKQPVVGNFVKLDAITTSATATYNLLNGGVAYFPQTANNCIVSLNGVIQSPTSAYTISGSTIVFSDALTASDSIDFILVLGDVLSIGTPSDATVSFAKVTSNLITGATAETSIAGGDSILIYDDSASALRKMTRTNFVSGIGGTNTPAFSVTKNANQTITDSSETTVTWNVEDFDTDNAFTSNTFTVPSGKAGKYFFYFTVYFYGGSTNNTNAVNLIFKVNGTEKIANVFDIENNIQDYGLNLVGVIDLADADAVTAVIYADTITGNGFVVSNTTKNKFGGFKLI